MYDLPSTSVDALVDDDDDDELEPLLGLTTKPTTDDEVRRKDGTLRQLLIKYVLCLIFVTMLGIGAWWLDLWLYDGDGGHRGISLGHGFFWFGSEDWGDREWLRPWVVQGLGWSSAGLYVSLPISFFSFFTS